LSTAISVYHGHFGRASLYALDRPMIKHAHREGHLIFWVRGCLSTLTIKDLPCVTSPEKAAAINPWELHSYDPHDHDAGQLCLVLYIKPEWFLNFSRTSVGALKFGRPEVEMTPLIARLIDRIVRLLTQDSRTDLLDGYLYELTSACFEQTHARLLGAQQPGDHQRINDFRVRKSIRLMTENVGQMMGLDDVATESGLSRPHFFKLFRSQTGVTPKLFWNTIRMERALTELAESPKSITDISLDLGFSSQSSFSRFFALNTGLAPTDYRRVAHVLHN
jgi:AraC-like DNA-binding protein